MTRILHLIHTPRASGAESLVRDLCLHHQGEGHSCAIAAFAPVEAGFAGARETLEIAGVGLFLPTHALARWRRVAHFRSAYRDFKPDCIFGHSVLPALYGRLALPWVGARPRFVPVLHSANTDDYADGLLRLSEQILTTRADRIVAVSTAGADRYNKRFPYGPSVTTIPNGIDIGRFESAPRHRLRLRTDVGLHESQRLILQVGRLNPVKQQLFALNALTSILKTHTNLQLWFAGPAEDADYELALRRAVREHGLETRVCLLGPRADIRDLLACADLYIMPSLQEAHSIAIVEALASGLPIVASEIPAFDFCRKFDGCWLYPPSDAASFATRCTAALSGHRYQRAMEDFDIGATARSYMNLIDCLH